MLDTSAPPKMSLTGWPPAKVYIGRIWPVWPTYTRITVGTQSEMEAFQEAFHAVMTHFKDHELCAVAPQAPLLSRPARDWPVISS